MSEAPSPPSSHSALPTLSGDTTDELPRSQVSEHTEGKAEGDTAWYGNGGGSGGGAGSGGGGMLSGGMPRGGGGGEGGVGGHGNGGGGIWSGGEGGSNRIAPPTSYVPANARLILLHVASNRGERRASAAGRIYWSGDQIRHTHKLS